MDITWTGYLLFLVGIGMGYVLSILAKLDEIEIETENERLGYERNWRGINEHGWKDHE